MSADEILLETEERLDKALTALNNDFRRIRTGRANPAMIEHVQAEAYGSMMPINQMASISVPEPTQIVIKPWDKTQLRLIEIALTNANLGMAPQNDGELIRLNVPALSEERRKQLAIQAKEGAEKCKVSMRNARREGIKTMETEGKEQKLPEDLVKKTCDDISELLKEYEAKAEESLKQKTEDILTI
ncbi:MAG: ribosome recycling factor [Planctomycetota bacterium]|jgi:ribosome recycling factor|nr:ribosome recycling factor [Planctomycetota bacterium]